MTDLETLYQRYPLEEVSSMLARALAFARTKPLVSWSDIQHELRIRFGDAKIILDWLVDEHGATPVVSTHWLRAARRYVLNNPFPTLEDMALKLDIGERRTFFVMQELERTGFIKIQSDFSFERTCRMSTFSDLVRQVRQVGKKYKGRCDPQLLLRTMYIDPMTAVRLSQYGEEHLGFVWKARQKDLS
ncbi:MAG: hypothetical protein RIQ56_690 [Candidatus Parcubacteria bacterium]